MISVEIYNSCYSPRSHEVMHRIQHASGVDVKTLEQDCAADSFVGQWRLLGNYVFNAGSEGSVTIDTLNSTNQYAGATAVRFVYDETDPPLNTPPNLQVGASQIHVHSGDLISLSANATDAEDGDISNNISWAALNQNSLGASFQIAAPEDNFTINVSISDSDGLSTAKNIPVNIIPDNRAVSTVYDFGCENLEPLPQNFVTNNAGSLPTVGIKCGRYTAELTNNANNITLHYHSRQGRFDGVLVTYPFSAVLRNVGVSPLNQPKENHQHSSSAFMFSGPQVMMLILTRSALPILL